MPNFICENCGATWFFSYRGCVICGGTLKLINKSFAPGKSETDKEAGAEGTKEAACS